MQGSMQPHRGLHTCHSQTEGAHRYRSVLCAPVCIDNGHSSELVIGILLLLAPLGGHGGTAFKPDERLTSRANSAKQLTPAELAGVLSVGTLLTEIGGCSCGLLVACEQCLCELELSEARGCRLTSWSNRSTRGSGPLPPQSSMAFLSRLLSRRCSRQAERLHVGLSVRCLSGAGPQETVLSVDRSGLYSEEPHSHGPLEHKEPETAMAKHLKTLIRVR